MKNIAKILVSLLIAAALLFAACKDEDDDEEETISESGATISVSGAAVYFYNDEDGTYTDLSGSDVNGTVYSWIESYKLEKGEEAGKITNGKLSFKLPDISDIIKDGSTFAEMFASGSKDTVITSTPTVSPSDAKMFFADLYAEIVGFERGFSLYYGNENVRTTYIYLDKSATVKGTLTQTHYYTVGSPGGSPETYTETYIAIFDCTLKKGWNTVYSVESGNTETYTTTKPAGTLRWIVNIR